MKRRNNVVFYQLALKFIFIFCFKTIKNYLTNFQEKLHLIYLKSIHMHFIPRTITDYLY